MTNNSLEMKTVVETYIIEETAELIYDDNKLSEWNRIVSELGLKGQTEIVVADKSPIPYLPINDNLKNVFEVLCPRREDVEKYNASPIPLEILSHVALSKREMYFQKIQIWYDDKDKDPLCIGVAGSFTPVAKDYTWFSENKQKSSKDALEWLKEHGHEPYNEKGGFLTDERLYLIGRWADVKRSFRELAEIAKERFITEERNRLTKNIRDMQRELEDLELNASIRLNPAQTNSLPF